MKKRTKKNKSSLIGKVVLYNGEVWRVLRDGLFKGCVDLRRPKHLNLDVKESKLILLN